MIRDLRRRSVAIPVNSEELFLAVERGEIVEDVDCQSRIGDAGIVVENLLDDIEVGGKKTVCEPATPVCPPPP
jgi:hypothetical protein